MIHKTGTPSVNFPAGIIEILNFKGFQTRKVQTGN